MGSGAPFPYLVSASSGWSNGGTRGNSNAERTYSLVSGAPELLERVIDRFLTSGDFNGLFVNGRANRLEAPFAEELVRQGLVQVVSERDYPNPHIRPWPSRHGMDAQLADLDSAFAGRGYGVCLYPTPEAMKDRSELDQWIQHPYTRELASGRGHLELAYFTLDVIEPYRNDPRYHFSHDDFEVHFGVAEDRKSVV